MDCSTLTIARGRTPRPVREHPPSRPGGPARGPDPKTLAASVLAQPIDNLSVTRLAFDGQTWQADIINHHP